MCALLCCCRVPCDLRCSAPRQTFPDRYKSHRSHDIVLLCAPCHQRCSTAEDKLTKKIGADMGVARQRPRDATSAHIRFYAIKSAIKWASSLQAAAAKLAPEMYARAWKELCESLAVLRSQLPSSVADKLAPLLDADRKFSSPPARSAWSCLTRRVWWFMQRRRRRLLRRCP